MAQVTVRINGYSYVVGCEDGQEPHLLLMAAQVDSRVESIKAIGGNSGEPRLLLLASLLLADELHDTRNEVEALLVAVHEEGHAEQLRARIAQRPRPPKSDAEAVARVSRLASKAEQIANGLEEA